LKRASKLNERKGSEREGGRVVVKFRGSANSGFGALGKKIKILLDKEGLGRKERLKGLKGSGKL